MINYSNIQQSLYTNLEIWLKTLLKNSLNSCSDSSNKCVAYYSNEHAWLTVVDSMYDMSLEQNTLL